MIRDARRPTGAGPRGGIPYSTPATSASGGRTVAGTASDSVCERRATAEPVQAFPLGALARDVQALHGWLSERGACGTSDPPASAISVAAGDALPDTVVAEVDGLDPGGLVDLLRFIRDRQQRPATVTSAKQVDADEFKAVLAADVRCQNDLARFTEFVAANEGCPGRGDRMADAVQASRGDKRRFITEAYRQQGLVCVPTAIDSAFRGTATANPSRPTAIGSAGPQRHWRRSVNPVGFTLCEIGVARSRYAVRGRPPCLAANAHPRGVCPRPGATHV